MHITLTVYGCFALAALKLSVDSVGRTITDRAPIVATGLDYDEANLANHRARPLERLDSVLTLRAAAHN